MVRRWTWSELGARPLFFPAVALVVGVSLPITRPQPAEFLSLALLAGMFAWALAPRVGSHLLVLLGLALGGHGLAALSVSERPTEPASGPQPIDVVIASASRNDVGSAAVGTIEAAPSQPGLVGAGIRLFARGEPWLAAGERWRIAAALKAEHPALNWGQSDPYEERRRQGVLLHAGFDASRAVRLEAAPRWRQWLERTRSALAVQVRKVAPSEGAAGLYLALASGERATLPPEIEEAFARSGLAHVLSVSGLHVAALALLLLASLRALLVRGVSARRPAFEARRLAAPLCIPLVWAYVLFTGMQAPAVRSGVMATAMLVGLSLWRRSDALNALSLAALAIVAVDPSSPFDLSLRLSFAAVLSLVLVSPAVRALFPQREVDVASLSPWRYRLHRVREEALQTLCASVAVVIAGVPLVAASFHRVSWVGLFSNVICFPLCGVLTALAAGGAAAFIVLGAWAAPLLWAGSWASALLLWLARMFARWPMASLPLPSLSAWAVAAFYAGLLVFALGRGRVRWAAVGTPLALVGTLAQAQVGQDVGLEVTFLSVGHGDAVVITSRGHTALIDGGGVPGGGDPGERIVLPYLRERGIRHLDLVVLSHPHPDHALGLPAVLRAIPTDRLWLGEGSTGGPLSTAVIEAAQGAQVVEVNEHTPPLRLGDATLDVLGPPADAILLEGVNDKSVVVRVRDRGATALFPGDIEAAGEEALAMALASGPVQLLKAPHHGSRTSSTEAFLGRVRPRFVVFSVGLDNRFHFPSPEVVRRYEALGTRTFRTDQDGAIRFVSDGLSFRSETYRASVAR